MKGYLGNGTKMQEPTYFLVVNGPVSALIKHKLGFYLKRQIRKTILNPHLRQKRKEALLPV